VEHIFKVDCIVNDVIYATNTKTGETVDIPALEPYRSILDKYKSSMLPMRYRFVLYLPNNYVLQPDFDAYDKLIEAVQIQRNALAKL
jgi:hypothetical protein